MYATCLFCHAKLGTNESIEHFPVGRRLAYDAAKGRLWVVCVKCERWNLSPLEHRWEAIEEAERAYRDTKKRVATDNIGLARLRDGTDLVRIGSPLRPEFAAWRYGDQFGRRRRRALIIGSTLALGAAGIATGLSMHLGSVIAAAAILPSVAFNARLLRRLVGARIPRARVLANDGRVVVVSDKSFQMVVLRFVAPTDGKPSEISISFTRGPSAPVESYEFRDPAGRLRTYVDPWERITGQAAYAALPKLLTVVNGFSASRGNVVEATNMLEERRTTEAFLTALPLKQYRPWVHRKLDIGAGFAALDAIPAPVRLALEMSLHEDSERRAMDGELHALELRWKEAEEIAAISDSLTLPGATVQRLEALKQNPVSEGADFPPQTD